MEKSDRSLGCVEDDGTEGGRTRFLAEAELIYAWHMVPRQGQPLATWGDLCRMFDKLEADFVRRVGVRGYPVKPREAERMSQPQHDARRKYMQRELARTLWQGNRDLATSMFEDLMKLDGQAPPGVLAIIARRAFRDELVRLDPKVFRLTKSSLSARARQKKSDNAKRKALIKDSDDIAKIQRKFKSLKTLDWTDRRAAREIAPMLTWAGTGRNPLNLEQSYRKCGHEVVLRLVGKK